MNGKLILAAVASVGLAATSGCLHNKSSRDPDARMRELLFESDGPRGSEPGLPRSNNDQPKYLPPERIHGGII